MGFWDALLKAGGKAAKNMGKAAAATGRSAGQAVLHPSQTLRGAGQAMKTAAIGSAAGYVAWEKLTTDKSVARIVGDTVIGETTAQAAASEAPEDSLTLAEALSRFEKVYLLNALKKNNWKRGPTADSLGMDRRTLFRKMKDFGLEKE